MEKEKMYRIKCGGRYVKFQMDGTVRGSKGQGAIISESYLNRYPFDVHKAIESGIITLEEVTNPEEINRHTTSQVL